MCMKILHGAPCSQGYMFDIALFRDGLEANNGKKVTLF